MTGVVALVGALGARRWILLKRYPVDTVGQLVAVGVLFVALFVGGRSLVGPDLGGSLGAVVVGYFLWTMGTGAYAALAQTFTAESRWGTLEQLFVAPRRFVVIAAAMAVVALLETLLLGGLVLAFMLALTGVSLHVDLLTVAVVGTLTLGSAVGVGLLVGGLAVLYKRVSSVIGLLQFAFAGFVAAPVGDHPSLHVLPMATGTHLLGLAMEDGQTLFALPSGTLAMLVGKAIVFVGLGLFALDRLVTIARRRGVVGHY